MEKVLISDRGNRTTIRFYPSEVDAIAVLNAMDANGCVGCSDCVDCSDCESCSGCNDCTYCKYVNDGRNSVGCINCSGIYNCNFSSRIFNTSNVNRQSYVQN